VKRFLASAGLAVALGATCISAAACNANWSGATAPAASVDGHTIVSVRNLDAALSALKNDKGWLCLNVGPVPQIKGVGSDSYSMSYVDDVLTNLVTFGLSTEYAQSHGLPLPQDPALVKAVDEIVLNGDDAGLAQLASQGAKGCSTGQAALTAEGATFRNAELQYRLAQYAILAHLAGTSLLPDQLKAFVARQPQFTTYSCIDVLVVTSGMVATVDGQIKAGKSWSSLVTSYQQDTSLGTDGFFGCGFNALVPAGLGSVVQSLKVNTPSAPVSIGGGTYVFIRPTSISSRTPSELDVLQELAAVEGAAFATLSNNQTKTAQVSISPAYGSWHVTTSSKGTSGTVVPDTGAQGAAPNPAAAGVTTTTIALGGPPGGVQP
jgi:hypothetical protein